MRTHYHEFESLEHLLATRLLPGGSNQPIRFVVFGGTGAVGGAVVLDLCRLILTSQRVRPKPLRGVIHATGMNDDDIGRLARRLALGLGDASSVVEIEPHRRYRIDDCIELEFSLLSLALPADLAEQVQDRPDGTSVEAACTTAFANLPQPFLDFVEQLDTDLLHGVVVAIPLPSVATYTLEIVDRIATEAGLSHDCRQRIKSKYLRRFVRGLAVIQQRHARHVVIAHTTAVGGMYRVDGGSAEIRLGFAHSALGKKLVEKKYFADQLTALYLDHGFDVLVTAAAIGIDAVEFDCRLPLDRAAAAALAVTGNVPDAASGRPPLIRLFPARVIDLDHPSSQALDFGCGEPLEVDAAIRSGENGLFSVANCVALYNVMKVAIPEELAMVLVRHAVFGPERRRDWFEDKICYYDSTENAHFALRMLDNDPRLVRAHLGAFAIQSFQALGSATHQARLHELGLLNLLLRLRELGSRLGTFDAATLAPAASDVDAFLWQHTRPPALEDAGGVEPTALAAQLGQLCEIETTADLCALLGCAMSERLRPVLDALVTAIVRYRDTITSLGIPIVYDRVHDGRTRVLAGPWVAPLERAIAHEHDLADQWRTWAECHNTDAEAVRDWTIVNNGFVDLRAHALACSAGDLEGDLPCQVRHFTTPDDVLAWLGEQTHGSYFTTGGVVAMTLRLRCLLDQLRSRKVELGTSATWKHLFRQDAEQRHILNPGLVETVRMYSEGLGKVTGTEALWPGWGYRPA